MNEITHDMDAKTALLVVDYTYDFVADGGALTAGAAAQRIDDAIAALIDEAARAGAFVAVCNDVHEQGDTTHPESRLFPPHNLRGTPGRELYGATRERVEQMREQYPERCVLLDKTRYNAFFATGLHTLLQQHGVTKLVLAGVCTDICILHTAMGGYELDYQLTVYERAVASFNPEAHAFALAHMKQSLGAEVVPAL